jgi:glycerophosphoryl diester phosphodiesterase
MRLGEHIGRIRCWALGAAVLLFILPGCKSTEFRSSHNLLDGKVLAVAHACGSFGTYRNPLPPNSVAALTQTIAQGVDGIELDVQMTADSQLVAFHDGLLDRVTACAGCIHDLNWADVKDCRYQTRNAGLDGVHPIVLLDTLLAHIAAADQEYYVFINSKHDSPCDPGDDGSYQELWARLLVEAIRRHDLGPHVMVESIDAAFLLKVRAMDPEIDLLFDDENYVRGMDMVRQNQFLGLCMSNGVVTAAQVEQAHAAGYWLGIWGVKVWDDTRRAVEKGPELIMTDDLQMLRAALKK